MFDSPRRQLNVVLYKMLKEFIQSFLPWILFFAFAGGSQGQLEIAIALAVICSVVFEYKALKKRFVLSWGTLVFFILIFIAVVLFKNYWIAKYIWLLSNGALAIIVWLSILLRKPFTIQYAKEQVPQDKWQHPLFYKINYLISGVWGITFLIYEGLNIIRVYQPSLNGWVYEIATYLPSVFAVWITTWFPDWYKERYFRKQNLMK